jgi:hypothetical protein
MGDKMKDDSVGFMCMIGMVLLIFIVSLIGIMHDKDVKVDCIKTISRQLYTVDEIYKLCGV